MFIELEVLRTNYGLIRRREASRMFKSIPIREINVEKLPHRAVNTQLISSGLIVIVVESISTVNRPNSCSSGGKHEIFMNRKLLFCFYFVERLIVVRIDIDFVVWDIVEGLKLLCSSLTDHQRGINLPVESIAKRVRLLEGIRGHDNFINVSREISQGF